MKRLTGKNEVRMLTFITWITYFSTYLGRLNFSASINEISMNLGIEKELLELLPLHFLLHTERDRL